MICSGRNAAAGATLVADLRKLGAEADFVAADVSREDDVHRRVEHAVARFGSLDIAVNSAGTEGTPEPLVNQTAQSCAATSHANILGTFLCMKHELRVMQAKRTCRGDLPTPEESSASFGRTFCGGAMWSFHLGCRHSRVRHTSTALRCGIPTGIAWCQPDIDYDLSETARASKQSKETNNADA